jgi:hypothetical protein
MKILQIIPFVPLTLRGRFDKESLLRRGDSREEVVLAFQHLALNCHLGFDIWDLATGDCHAPTGRGSQ